MKLKLFVCLVLLILATTAYAQNDVGGATVPVMRTPTPETTPAPGSGVNTVKPVPESTIQPVPVPHTPSAEETAADKAIRTQADEDVTSYAEKVSDNCDASFKARIDWTTVSPLQTHRYSPADACGAALQAIDEICTTSAAKERVASEIKSVICTTGPNPSIEMHGGTLVYTIDWQAVSPGAKVYAWLATHL